MLLEEVLAERPEAERGICPTEDGVKTMRRQRRLRRKSEEEGLLFHFTNPLSVFLQSITNSWLPRRPKKNGGIGQVLLWVLLTAPIS